MPESPSLTAVLPDAAARALPLAVLRTVAAHIARLREQHDAGTLFQLGRQMRGEPMRGDQS